MWFFSQRGSVWGAIEPDVITPIPWRFDLPNISDVDQCPRTAIGCKMRLTCVIYDIKVILGWLCGWRRDQKRFYWLKNTGLRARLNLLYFYIYVLRDVVAITSYNKIISSCGNRKRGESGRIKCEEIFLKPLFIAWKISHTGFCWNLSFGRAFFFLSSLLRCICMRRSDRVAHTTSTDQPIRFVSRASLA